ncbi:MAG: class I adenylate-forming enzyme family protein [Candidatus Helarchaeota archaeon]
MGKSPFKAMFDIKADYYPKDRISVVYGDIKRTWKEEKNRINRLTYSLKKKLGIKKGDNVAVLFHNRPEFLESNLALQAIGAVPVPVNYRYVKSELEFLLSNSDAIGLIFEGELMDLVLETKADVPTVKFYICATDPDQELPEGMYSYEALIEAGKNKNTKADVSWDDTCVIIYTGGTTGRPKGVMLSYENMVVNQEATINLLITFLPKVKDIDYPKFARNKGQEKILKVLNSFIGQMYGKLFNDPDDRKIIVFELPTAEDAVPIPPITIRQVEQKLKLFYGKPEEYDVLFEGSIMDQIRELVNLLPKSYSKKGKMKMFPGLIWKFLFGGVHMEGSFRDRLRIIKSLSSKPDEDHFTVMYLTPPMFHLAAYALFILNWLLSGSVLVFPESLSFNPAQTIDTMVKNKVGWTFFVPVMWRRIVKYLEENRPDFQLESLEVAFSGAALLHAGTKKKILKYFPEALLLDVFGQTEMAPAASVKIDGDAETVRDRSVGKVIPNIEIKIVDDDGNQVKEGEIGEILYRGPNVMKGYYGDPEKTASTIDEEGWLHSGDLGYMKEGELYTIERKKECINTGGEKVFPLEIEEVILKHPKVQEVCVIGVPDEDWGSSVRAVIIPQEGLQPEIDITSQEIIDFCRGRMAGYKKPKSVVFTTSFPISPVGKVLRAKIREEFGKPELVKGE